MSESRKTVFVVGLGPGGGQFLTVQAQSALQQAEVLCGYTVYIDLVRPLYPEKECYTTGMTREIDRCRWALDTARAGRDVALVCSGDAGVYGMASPLLELAEEYPDVNVEVVPGLTAALSGGAVLGRAAGPRFLRHFAVGPSHAVGGHRKAAGLRRPGRFRTGAVQSLLQGPPGLSAPGRGHPAGKRQSPGHPLRLCAEHWPGRAGKAHPASQPAPGHRGGYVHHRLCGQRRHSRAERADGHAAGVRR